MEAKAAFEKWWREQTRRGDPERRPDLVRDAFMAAYQQGWSDKKADADET